MLLFSTLVSLGLLADATLASSGSTGMKVERHIGRKLVGSGQSIAQVERARIAKLAEKFSRKRSAEPRAEQTGASISNDGIEFIATIGVGCPPTDYRVLIDSGSSYTWIGHNKTYVHTESSKNTHQPISISYGDGTINGTQWLDKLTLTPSLVVENMPIGVDDRTGNFVTGGVGVYVDGLIGIGSATQSLGILLNQPNATIPTVTDYLKTQKQIKEKVVGLYYPPYKAKDAGEISFGTADKSKYTGSLTYASSTPNDWYIPAKMSIGNTTFIEGSGLVDSGTILIYLSAPQFESYVSASGGDYDPQLNMISISKENLAKLQPLDITINGKTFRMNADAQTWPVELNYVLGLPKDTIYLIVSTFGNVLPFDFIMGYTFFERFYAVLDSANSRVGFAPTKYTNAVINNPL